MSVEVPHRPLEDLEQSRQAMIKHAAGRLALLEEGVAGPLRPYQVPAIRSGLLSIVGAEVEGSPQVLGRFEEATGWGKTPAQIHLLSSLGFGKYVEGKPALPEGTQAITLVPTQYLRDQMYHDFARFAPNISVGVRGHKTDGYPDDGEVLLSTYNYAINAYRRGEFRAGQFGIINSDEAHRSLGAQTLPVMQALQGYAYHYGWSATPGYSEERSIARTLPHLINRTTVREGILHSDPEKRFLSGVRLFSVHTGENVHEFYHSKGDYASVEVAHLADSRHRNSMIVHTALHALENTKGKGLIKCVPGNGQAHAYKIAAMLSEQNFPGTHRKIRTVAVSGRSKTSREDIKRFAETSDYDVVIYIDMLGEGVNIKDLAWGVFAAPTKSYVKIAQFLGRGLRPKSNGAPFYMYQLIDSANHKPQDMAYAWEVLDLKEEPEQGFLVAPDTDTNPATSDKHPLPKTKGSHFRAKDLDATPYPVEDLADPVLSVLAEQMIPAEIHETHTSFETLQEGSNLDPKWLKRLLAINGYVAIHTSGAEPDTFIALYPNEAATFLRNEVAGEDDLPQAAAASLLGLTMGGLRARAAAKGKEFEPVPLYTFEPGREKILHYTEAQIAALDNRPSKLAQAQRISLTEIAHLAGIPVNSTRKHLTRRNFTTEPIRNSNPRGQREVVGYLKDEATAWAEAFAAATETDTWSVQGHKDVENEICAKHNISLSNAWSVAVSTGIPMRIFKNTANKRIKEYISDEDFASFDTAVRQWKEANQPDKPAEDNQASEEVTALRQQSQYDSAENREFYQTYGDGYIRRRLPYKGQRNRDLFQIPYLVETATKPHISTKDLAHMLEEQGITVKKGTLDYYAQRYGFETIRTPDKSLHLGVEDADNLLSVYFEFHNDSNDKETLPVNAIANKLNCSQGVVRALIQNHPLLEDAKIEAQEDGTEIIKAKYLETMYRIIETAVSGRSWNGLFIAAYHIKPDSRVRQDPKSGFPAEYQNQITSGAIPLGDNGVLHMLYGTPQVKEFMLRVQARKRNR